MDAWCEALGPVEPERIRQALANVLTSHPEWPPTLGQFLALCKPLATPAAHRLFLVDKSPRQPIDAQVKERIAALVRKMKGAA